MTTTPADRSYRLQGLCNVWLRGLFPPFWREGKKMRNFTLLNLNQVCSILQAGLSCPLGITRFDLAQENEVCVADLKGSKFCDNVGHGVAKSGRRQ